MDATRLSRRALRRYLAGDLLAVVGFVLLGQFRHGTGPLVAPGRFPGVVAPFLLGWAVAAPLAGAYLPATADSRRAALGRALASWLVAAVVAQTLRATPPFPGDADPAFFAVTVVLGGTAIAGLRTLRGPLARRIG